MSIILIILGILSNLIFSTFVGIDSKASDTERQTDIKALHGYVEVFYVDNAYYPTLANLNDSSWRQTNLRGLNDEALKDPDGSGYTLAANPVSSQYSYAAQNQNGAPCDNTTGNECQKYELTATLEDGTTYKKQNLN